MRKIPMFLLVVLSCLGFAYAQNANMPKFKGLMFGDYFYYAGAHNGTLKDFNGFDLRRIYFTTDFTISNVFSSRFRLEANQTVNSLTPGEKFGVMVKDAWLKWHNIFQGSDLYFGISPTPAFAVSQAAWGHRFLEKTILQLNGIVSSRDLGVDLKGNITGSGSVKYWVKFGNNSSNGPELNKYKRLYGMIEFNPVTNFLMTLYGDYAGAPSVYDPVDGRLRSNNSYVGSIFLNYRNDSTFSAGLEAFFNKIENNFAPTFFSPLETQTKEGISVWAWGNISQSVRLVGRFDYFDPNINIASDSRTLILAGVDINTDKNVIITPNIEIISYQVPPLNGGGSSDIIPRITLYWQL